MTDAPTASTLTDPSPPSFVDALLFDLDGTLVDSETANLTAYNVAVGDLGINIAPEWYSPRFGLPAPVVMEELRTEWGVDFDVSEYVARKNRAYGELASSIEVYPVMRKLLTNEHSRRRTGVVTSGPTATATTVLEATGLALDVDVLVSRDDVEATKPAPDAYLLAARRLGVAPDRCLAYEDTAVGLEAARAAAMAVVDVRPSLTSRAQ